MVQEDGKLCVWTTDYTLQINDALNDCVFSSSTLVVVRSVHIDRSLLSFDFLPFPSESGANIKEINATVADEVRRNDVKKNFNRSDVL